MSTVARARRFELQAAEHRLVQQLKAPEGAPSTARRAVVLGLAAALFAGTFAARLAVSDPNALLANFYIVPTVVLAIEYGRRAGLTAAAVSIGLTFAWAAIEAVHLGALGYISRAAVVLVTGVVVGRFSERLRLDISARQLAQRNLAVYADQLERANQHLVRSVEQLEAFAEIARSVGGETDLERVLQLILARGREIVVAHGLVILLREGEELAPVTASTGPTEGRLRLAIHGSVAGEVLRSGRPQRLTGRAHAEALSQLDANAASAILVPLLFRGERLGVLAAIEGPDGRTFEDDDEQLLESVAASAATAVATARSVADARLRLSLEAADQARARWARELHDETLQGLTGARMVLSAGLVRDDLTALRGAVEAADAHLSDETRRLRDLIAELRPAALDDFGLGPAIESLAKRQAAIGAFAVELELALAAGERLPRDTETAIYRIVQEALTNAVKHAEARQVSLRVDRLPDRVEVSVQDDGRGFSPPSVTEGFGLTGMRERALLAGGHLSLSSKDGGPTVVAAVLPIPRG